MKRFLFFAAVMAVFSFSSCDKEMSENVVPGGSEGGIMTIRAEISNHGVTKTALGNSDNEGEYHPVWSEGDKIAVLFSGTDTAIPFTLVSGANTASAVFQGEAGAGSYQAFYPYDLLTSNTVSDGVLQISVPQEYAYSTGTFAPNSYPMLSSTVSGGEVLQFENLFSVVKVSLKGNAQVNDLIFASNNGNAMVSGAMTLDMVTKNLTFAETANSTVTIKGAGKTLLEDTATDFFFTIPAQQYSGGFTITVVTPNGEIEKTTEETVDFSASQLRNVFATVVEDGITIPDPYFKAYILEKFDSNHDGKLSQEEADNITDILIGELPDRERVYGAVGATSLSGIEHFTNLARLTSYNLALTGIDLSQNTNLVGLTINGSGLNSLDLSKNVSLTSLDINNNNISSLDLSKNVSLTSLNISNNGISSLDLSENVSLKELAASGNNLSSLDLSHNADLETLTVGNNHISSLDLSDNPKLLSLICSGNGLQTLDLSANANLGYLDVKNNELTELDVTGNLALYYLGCSNNEISTLATGSHTGLITLECENNHLEVIDLHSLSGAVEALRCSGNEIETLLVPIGVRTKWLDLHDNNITCDIDVTGAVWLKDLYIQGNAIPKLYVKASIGLPLNFTKDDSTEIVYSDEANMQVITTGEDIAL